MLQGINQIKTSSYTIRHLEARKEGTETGLLPKSSQSLLCHLSSDFFLCLVDTRCKTTLKHEMSYARPVFAAKSNPKSTFRNLLLS